MALKAFIAQTVPGQRDDHRDCFILKPSNQKITRVSKVFAGYWRVENQTEDFYEEAESHDNQKKHFEMKYVVQFSSRFDTGTRNLMPVEF